MDTPELEMIKDLLYNVNPNVTMGTLKDSLVQLPFQNPMIIDKSSPELKDIWRVYMSQQNECIKNQMGIKTFALLLTEIRKIADKQGLLVRKNRQIPGYLTNLGELDEFVWV